MFPKLIHLVFLAGEAGVGKTPLMAALSAAVQEADIPLRVLRGTCDNQTTPAALGPVLEAIPQVLDLVEGDGAVDRVSLFRRIRDHLSAAPTLLVLDDVHWAAGPLVVLGGVLLGVAVVRHRPWHDLWTSQP